MLVITAAAILFLAAAAGLGVWMGMGDIVPFLEIRYIREALRASKSPPERVDEVEAILAEYRAEAERMPLSPRQWWAAGKAFERSPAVAVLAILEIRENLPPEGDERARAVLDRLMRAVVDGELTPEGFLSLIEESRARRSASIRRPGEVTIGIADLARFLAAAEKVLDERDIPPGPFSPDLARLLRRNLFASLGR